MSSKSNDQGRAFEFMCLLTLQDEVAKIRQSRILKNSAYYAAERAWNSISQSLQRDLTKSSKSMVKAIFALEPRIVEDGTDCLDLLIQTDEAGEAGDVRDILIVRRNIKWEVGLSLKHNHFAVKHSRLSSRLDFCNSWFGIPCTRSYWDEVRPTFRMLEEEKQKGTFFRNLPNKDRQVYRPILTAFINELRRQNDAHSDIPAKMVEYLLGRFDFYKVISIDADQITQVSSYNMHGTLNKPSATQRSNIEVPRIELPTRIISLDFKPGSNNTVELCLDKGWAFSFRIHNAKDLVEPSLKFDVQMIGMPTTVLTINCRWI